MACMDHECLDCGEQWFDDKLHPACPNEDCQSENVTNHFDEHAF